LSRLLDSVDRAIASTQDASVLLGEKTRRFIYLARRGDSSEAQSGANELRALSQRGDFASGTASANLVEGVCAFYAGDSALGFDKLRRASALSAADPQGRVRRLVHAWLAHANDNVGRPESVATHALAVLDFSPTGEHDVRSRLFSVVAAGLHFGNRADLARPWYELARRHAVSEGDDLTIDANLCNVAANRIHNLRLDQITGQADRSEIQRARLEHDSSVNYDRLNLATTFRWLLPLNEARQKMLEGDFSGALQDLDGWFSGVGAESPAAHLAVARTDKALCLGCTGETAAAQLLCAEVLDELPVQIDDGELAIIYFRNSQVAALFGARDLMESHRAKALDRLAVHAQLQQLYVNALSPIPIPIAA
jgi:hypothetical protein